MTSPDHHYCHHATPLLSPDRNPSTQRKSIPHKLTHFPIDRAHALEALRRSQYKFPGRQKIIISKNWGFTPLRREEYLEKKAAGRVKVDGAYVQFLSNHGPLKENMKRFPEAFSEA